MKNKEAIKKIEKMTGTEERGYVTNCEYVQERTGDYKKMKLVQPKFRVTKKNVDGCGNLCGDLFVNRNTKKAKFKPGQRGNLSSLTDTTNVGFYEALPSALLMYRLACLFPGSIETMGQDGYKFVWQFRLEHVATKTKITFGEWKGGSLFWTEGTKVDKAFLKDVEELITLLVSDNCPHPYDGLVAGSVA